MKDSRLITYTVDKLLKDSYFRRGVCQISSICGSVGASWGGITGNITDQADLVTYVSDQLGTVDLQSVTTGTDNNKTSNVIHQSGIDNLDSSFDGISIYGIAGTAAVVANFATNGVVRFEPGKTTIGVFNTALILNEVQDSSIPGAQFSTSRVQGTAAINSDEFTTLGQVEALIPEPLQNVTLSSEPVAPLNPNTYYTNNFDIDDVEWILPPVAGNAGKMFGVINIHEVNITLNSNSGGNDIFSSGFVSSIIIPAQTSRILYCNGGLWVVLS